MEAVTRSFSRMVVCVGEVKIRYAAVEGREGSVVSTSADV
jgi:hypothetical protein